MIHKIPSAAALLGAAVISGGAAQAQEIDGAINATVFTSQANNGSPGDVVVTEDGAIEFEDTTGAEGVVVDSDHSVLLDGDITIEDSDDSTGILVSPGRQSSIEVNGRIELIEDYEREDEDGDDDDDGPIAVGTGRTGLLLEEGGPLTGDIVFGVGSVVTVEGNQSAAVQLGSDLDGDFVLDGSLNVRGDEAVGVDVKGAVTGDVIVSGSVSATGQGGIGVSLADGAGGAVVIEGAVSATGFTSTSATNYVAPANVDEETEPLEERRDADDLFDGGPALAIGGSAPAGLLINGRVDDFVSEEDSDDETKDTVEDFDENRSTGSVSAFGSAPALLISPDWGGTATGDLVLGPVVETVRDTLDDDEDDDDTETLAVFNFDQGFINRGSITSRGLNVGFDSRAVEISGSADGLYETQIVGGILNTGTISSNAVEANATTLRLGNGAMAGALINDGTITSQISTTEATQAYAILIEDGAELTSIENTGQISAISLGNTGAATAILDRSGTLTTITNLGRIEGRFGFDGIETDVSEDGIAIDLSQTAVTSDTTLIQRRDQPVDDVNGDDEIDEDDVATPSIEGHVLFGSGNDAFISDDGSVSGDIDFGDGINTLDFANTEYAGDVRVSGSASDLTLSEDTSFDGDVYFTSGTNTLALRSGAVFSGDIFVANAQLALSVENAELRLDAQSATALETLTLDGASVLEVEIDPLDQSADPVLNVAGTASLSTDTQIRPIFTTVSNTDFSRTIIEADTIAFDGEVDASLLTETRFLYETDVRLVDGDRERIDLVYALKTPEALGLDVNQSAAYESVLEVFSADDELGVALATIEDEATFFQVYNQLLPQRSEASTRYLAAQASASFGVLADRLDLIPEARPDTFRLWAQENFTYLEIDETPGAPGYNGDGLGFSLGVDRAIPGFDAIGLMASFQSGQFEEKTGGANPVSTSSYGLGAYAQSRFAGIVLRAAGQVSTVSFSGSREIDIVIGEADNETTDDPLDEADLFAETDADWGGWSTAASFSAHRDFEISRLYARPQLGLDYFRLSQDSYTETTLRYEDLALTVYEAVTDRVSATALLALGVRFGGGDQFSSTWISELRTGYRSELSSTPYETSVQYGGASSAFDIVAQESFDDALMAGLSIVNVSERFSMRLSYDVELMDNGATHHAGATASFRF